MEDQRTLDEKVADLQKRVTALEESATAPPAPKDGGDLPSDDAEADNADEV